MQIMIHSPEELKERECAFQNDLLSEAAPAKTTDRSGKNFRLTRSKCDGYQGVIGERLTVPSFLFGVFFSSLIYPFRFSFFRKFQLKTAIGVFLMFRGFMVAQ